MYLRFYCGGLLKWMTLGAIVLAVGCHQQPSAERLEYDPETVELLREEIKSVDWDE